MKTNLLSFKLIIGFFLVGFYACDVNVTDDNDITDSPSVITSLDAPGWIYSRIEMTGTSLNANCNNSSVTLTKNSTDYALDIIECTSTSLVAWIPEDMETGMYAITANVDGTEYTTTSGVFNNGDPMEVEVKNRPVILSMSATSLPPLGTLVLDGINLANTTGIESNDPMVWLTRPNYTNTVSEITVNSEGTQATIIVDDMLESGEYDLKLTVDEWSNEVQLTIE